MGEFVFAPPLGVGGLPELGGYGYKKRVELCGNYLKQQQNEFKQSHFTIYFF